MPKVPNEVKTLEIDNFGGRLTRVNNGNINSGLAKFNTSFGYDPFTKPGQLTWLDTPVDLDPTDASIGMTIVCGLTRQEGIQEYVYAVGTNYSNAAKLFKIQPNSIGNPNLDTSSVINNGLTNNSFLYGGSMEVFGPNTGGGTPTSILSISNDTKLITINTAGANETSRATLYSANMYHPLAKFLGNLFVGDGINLSKMDNTLTVTSSVLAAPGLPSDVSIGDMVVDPNGTYLSMAASAIPTQRQDATYDRVSANAGTGYVFDWNGSDPSYTKHKSFPSHVITALKTYMTSQYLFSNDSFGATVDDNSQKILTLPNNRSVIPNAVASNGNFLTWVTTENVDSTLKGSMYYFGSLDKDNPVGLWRMFRLASTQTNGFIYTTPFNLLVSNNYSSVNNAITSVVAFGYGKHYFSTLDYSQGQSTTKFKLYRFLVAPGGISAPQFGVYETQNELFSKKITLNEIRVYTQPTAAGNGFQIDLIGNDGQIITNGTFNYTFSAGSDITLLQGALDRINFNPNNINIYSLALRITNTGTTNMTINKIEVDYSIGGK